MDDPIFGDLYFFQSYILPRKKIGFDTDTETHWTLVSVPDTETWFGLYTGFAIGKPSKTRVSL